MEGGFRGVNGGWLVLGADQSQLRAVYCFHRDAARIDGRVEARGHASVSRWRETEDRSGHFLYVASSRWRAVS